MNAQPRIAIVTAGAANMICGSCLHDNAVARALYRSGVDVRLIPTYTPIRTDEPDVSIDQVFFGGINVYLDQKLPLFRHLPASWVRWLDSPRLLRWVSQRGIETDASQLGPMCVSMLRGERGRQRREVFNLARFFQSEFRPQLVSFSNILIAGAARVLKQQLRVPLVVTLQGDDFFLHGLPDRHRRQALAEIAEIDKHVDRYLSHTACYADAMSQFLGLPREKIHIVPLGVSTEDLPVANRPSPDRRSRTVGYLARIAPEKGLHQLCTAVGALWQDVDHRDLRLKIAGWMSSGQREYLESSLQPLMAHGNDDAVTYLGELDRAEKSKFLATIDALCVPSPYVEPKGLYVLEALASGVPVVCPDHGAFPELLADTGGGRLFRANDPDDLARVLSALLKDDAARLALGQAAQAAVRQRRSSAVTATAMMTEFQELIEKGGVGNRESGVGSRESGVRKTS